jgi:hemolysin III
VSDSRPATRSPLCDSHREEVASLWTHAAGVVLAFCALGAMLVLSAGDLWKSLASSVFGVSMITMYASSAMYHFFTSVRWKARMQAVDHACIYLLIAGSYTPFCMLALPPAWGFPLLALVWVLAAAGVAVKVFIRIRRDHWISTALYLAMGWLVLAVVVPLVRALPPAGMAWLVAGGLAYTGGVGFFLWNRLPFNHAIWHLFVLTGTACHAVAVIFHVL